MREEQKKVIQKEMDRLKHLDIIHKGLTSYSSPVVLVKQKNQNLYQVCSDFRILKINHAFVMILHYNTTLTPSSKTIYSGTTNITYIYIFHHLFCIHVNCTISNLELNYRLKFSLAYKDIHEKNTLFY